MPFCRAAGHSTGGLDPGTTTPFCTAMVQLQLGLAGPKQPGRLPYTKQLSCHHSFHVLCSAAYTCQTLPYNTTISCRLFCCSTGSLDPAVITPFCAAMQQLGLDNQGIPERLHPKSFHSAFGHNTNVWASRESKVSSTQQYCSSAAQLDVCDWGLGVRG
jgi:hypothetical protein